MRLLALLLLAMPPVWAAEAVYYEVSFPNAVHHEAEVSVTFPKVRDPVLEVLMARSSPGRYTLHEFAKNVYSVAAYDGAGKPITIERAAPSQWNIRGHDGTVRVTYTLFGDCADGTYSAIDETHAHLNMPATFLWSRAMRARPIRLRFAPPEDLDWRAATQLEPTGDPLVFAAPNLDYFFDSPVELSVFKLREWEVNDGTTSQTLRLAIHDQGTEPEADAYALMAQAVVREQIGIFGELPRFDFGTYTFLADYLPWVSSDGMEHRNSTVLATQGTLADNAARLIGGVAHEFFHAWNVERLRPKSLEPFDYQRANMSRELWFAEGFTSYYTGLTLVRAGLRDIDGYARSLSGTLGSVLKAPGHRYVSPVEASMLAPFSDRPVAAEPTNQRNTFISYYGYGSVVGLGLDLTLRTRFPGVTLDDYMRALWKKYGRRETPYNLQDLETTLGEVTGDAAFAREFFANYIRGRKLPDYEALLAKAGFLLRETGAEKASLGPARLRFTKDGAVIESGTLIGSPLYDAGLDRGARILELDGRRITSKKAYEGALAEKQPGETVDVTFEQRGKQATLRVELAAAERLEVVPVEHTGSEPDAPARTFREAWLGSKAPGGAPHLKRYCPRCNRAFPFLTNHCPFDGEKLGIVRK